jgi:hypothetical protein
MKQTQLHRMTGAGATSARFLTEDDAQSGVFGSLLRLRREARHREAQADRERRLVELDRDIKALEAWHHAWRLVHEADYRELHADELAAKRERLSRRITADRDAVPVEVRRAATRRIAADFKGAR